MGQIAIAKAETIDIAEAKEPTALRPIDPQVDWLDRAGFPNAARAYEFYEPWTLSVAATRYELEDVSRTSIDRAYVRVVETHGQQLAVQAIYRLRTARQRVKLALPAALDPATAFDDQALHINGKKVPLEKEAGAYWVPIATPASETPVLVELKYNLAGTAAQIELPHFPEEPAVQKVYVAAFIPKEWVMLGQTGNWSDEQPWQPPPILQMLGVAPQECGCPTDDEILGWVQEGLSLPGNPRDRFSVVGSPLIFSALQPPSGDALKTLGMGSLHARCVRVCGDSGLGSWMFGEAVIRTICVTRCCVCSGLPGSRVQTAFCGSLAARSTRGSDRACARNLVCPLSSLGWIPNAKLG